MSNHDDDPYGAPPGSGGDWQQKQPSQQHPGQQPGQQPGGPMIHQPPPPQHGGGGSNQPLEQNDVIAIVLSFFIPGAGQLMLGQTTKGLVILAVMVFTCYGFGLLPLAAAVDAYLVARAKKYRALEEFEFFPDFKEAFNL